MERFANEISAVTLVMMILKKKMELHFNNYQEAVQKWKICCNCKSNKCHDLPPFKLMLEEIK